MTAPMTQVDLDNGQVIAVYQRLQAEKAGAIRESWAWGALMEWSEPLQRLQVKMTRPFDTLNNAILWMDAVKAGQIKFFESIEKPPVEPVFK